MKNLKIRIWVKPEKKFYFMNIEELLFETFSKWEMKELDIQMFTGLLDSHGKEIYEGDLIRIKIPINYDNPLITHEYFSVVFDDGMFCLKMSEGNFQLCEYLNQEAEVVGNIYENPELLKKNKNEN